MELIWFYVAIVLAISDTIHTQIVWKIFNKFYLILGGIINNSVNAPWKTWIIHELMEAGFHFIFVSIAFLNLEIGILAAFIHFVIDVSHTLLISSHTQIITFCNWIIIHLSYLWIIKIILLEYIKCQLLHSNIKI